MFVVPKHWYSFIGGNTANVDSNTSVSGLFLELKEIVYHWQPHRCPEASRFCVFVWTPIRSGFTPTHELSSTHNSKHLSKTLPASTFKTPSKCSGAQNVPYTKGQTPFKQERGQFLGRRNHIQFS